MHGHVMAGGVAVGEFVWSGRCQACSLLQQQHNSMHHHTKQQQQQQRIICRATAEFHIRTCRHSPWFRRCADACIFIRLVGASRFGVHSFISPSSPLSLVYPASVSPHHDQQFGGCRLVPPASHISPSFTVVAVRGLQLGIAAHTKSSSRASPHPSRASRLPGAPVAR